MFKIFFAFIGIGLISLNTYSALCTNWSASQKIGVLDPQMINESSGLAISAIFENRLYHINDSGDGPFFYQTNTDGSNGKKVAIEGFIPQDVEDLAYGKFGDKHAIYIGDIGDNLETREQISIVIIEEKENFPESIIPLKTMNAHYPDRAHNAEGMAVHPNGDLYILTKKIDFENRRAMSAQLFRISRELLQSETQSVVMEHVASFELPYILYNYNLWGRIVTSFDISPDGSKILIMTYKAAVEVTIDLSTSELLSTRQWEQNLHYKIVETEKLPQQEALSYLPNGRGFIYTTEYNSDFGSVPIFKVTCSYGGH